MAYEALAQTGISGLEGFGVAGPVGALAGVLQGFVSGILGGKAATEAKRGARYYYRGAVEQRVAAEAQAGAVEAAAKLGIAQAQVDVINLARYAAAGMTDAARAGAVAAAAAGAGETKKAAPDVFWLVGALVVVYLLMKG